MTRQSRTSLTCELSHARARQCVCSPLGILSSGRALSALRVRFPTALQLLYASVHSFSWNRLDDDWNLLPVTEAALPVSTLAGGAHPPRFTDPTTPAFADSSLGDRLGVGIDAEASYAPPLSPFASLPVVASPFALAADAAAEAVVASTHTLGRVRMRALAIDLVRAFDELMIHARHEEVQTSLLCGELGEIEADLEEMDEVRQKLARASHKHASRHTVPVPVPTGGWLRCACTCDAPPPACVRAHALSSATPAIHLLLPARCPLMATGWHWPPAADCSPMTRR